MNYLFDRNYWYKQLKHPDWYIRLENELNKYIFPIVHDDLKLKEFRHKICDLVEEMLEKNEIPLAEKGPNLDSQRDRIDTIIIHHTEEDPDIRLSKLSAIGFIRQYGRDYLRNDVLGYEVKGKPIWSGHFRDNKMVFFAYHWLVRQDGSAERLLKDEYIGWQSAVWQLNKRSIAVALSGNYEHAIPPPDQIEGAAIIIKENYPHINIERILGHREVKEGRTCPGEFFLSGWKAKLLDNAYKKF